MQITPPQPRSTLGKCAGLTLRIALIAGAALHLHAQDESSDLAKLKSLSIEQIMQIQIPTVYGASKHEQKITDAPSSVSIITREEIQAYGHRTLADILRSVRDISVSYDRNYGYIGVRGSSRPGDFGGRILVLVDGLRVNDPIYDGVGVMTDFVVDVDMIERVEVIRGPGSALYGNNAYYAVVNVVTRTASDVHGIEASAEAGSFDTFKGRLSYGNVFSNGLSVLLTGTAFDTAGDDLFYKEFNQPVNHQGLATGMDGDRFYSAGATISYQDFTLQSGYVTRTKKVPTASYNSIFDDSRLETTDHYRFTRLTYAHEFEHELNLHADVYCNSYRLDGDYPVAMDASLPRHATINHDFNSAQWWGAEVQLSKQLFAAHRVTLGADFQDNYYLKLLNYDVEPRLEYLRLNTSTQTFGTYLQDEWSITPNTTLDAGLRYDHCDTFGSTVNPRLAVIHHLHENTTLKLLYGQAFRAPNVYETFYVANTNQSNPGLGPERIRSYEAVLEQALTPALRLGVSAFYNRTSDLISAETDPATDKIFYQNVEQAETKGASVELEAKLMSGIKGRVSYSLQHTTNTMTGDPVDYSPEHLAKLNLIVPLYHDKIFSGLELQVSSSAENGKGKATGGYVLTNWTLFSNKLTDHLDVSASIYNLFDQKYGFPGGPEHVQDSIVQDGRTFRLKFTYRF